MGDEESSLYNEPVRAFPFQFGSIKDQIDAAVAKIPEDQHGALIAIADLDDVKLAVVARLKGGWSFVGMLDKPYHGALEGSVAFTRSF